jgi:UDP-N-acetylmuramoyl-L-alanyl-D-glutamate--2,6-diaminopimelate ligase
MSGTVKALLAAAEPTEPKPLGELLDRLAAGGILSGSRDAGRGPGGSDLRRMQVSGIALDSREVRPGHVFVAIPGEHVDGHAFIGAAAARGAVAALVGHVAPLAALPQVPVTDPRRALAAAAVWWYGDPSRELGVVGVTGTDGKTTTSFLAVATLEAAGYSTGLIGTVETGIGRVRVANEVHATTPEAPTLQGMLRAMVAAGNRAAVVETTSHGLAQERVAGIAYDAAILTNLSHEHLEFHGTPEAYLAAKRSLFERLAVSAENPPKGDGSWPRTAVINLDDPSAGAFLVAARAAGAAVVTYGTDPAADVALLEVEEGLDRLRLRYRAPGGSAGVALRLAGRFNALNALAVVALGAGLGLDPAAIHAGLEAVPGVPGRMERISVGQPFTVIVDYAHTPAALAAVLDGLAPLAAAGSGGLIVVFGSAGERDTAKRPMMGRIAGERCRLVILTDEDPRGEDRETILNEIAAGVEAAGLGRGRGLLLVPDRAAAIRAAFDRAGPGDVVLLAGKGHEASIIDDRGPQPWDERAAALAALAALGFRDG